MMGILEKIFNLLEYRVAVLQSNGGAPCKNYHCMKKIYKEWICTYLLLAYWFWSAATWFYKSSEYFVGICSFLQFTFAFTRVDAKGSKGANVNCIC